MIRVITSAESIQKSDLVYQPYIKGKVYPFFDEEDVRYDEFYEVYSYNKVVARTRDEASAIEEGIKCWTESDYYTEVYSPEGEIIWTSEDESNFD